MAELRDDSPIFSLRGLLELERARGERAAREREQAAALERERDRITHEAGERKRQSMLQAARIEEERRREDQARLEALKHAAIELVRAQAEGRALLELAEKQQGHERVLLAMRQESRQRRARELAIVGFVLFGLAVACALAVYFGKLRPEAARLQVAYDELVLAERNRAEETKRLLERTEQRRSDLAKELETANARIDELVRALGSRPAGGARTDQGESKTVSSPSSSTHF